MLKCPGCGEDNPPKFRLCGYCGTPLAPAAPAPAPLPVREMRKTVTVIFCDLKDSTALGERLDSETLHEVKTRYFDAMQAEILRHGGVRPGERGVLGAFGPGFGAEFALLEFL